MAKNRILKPGWTQKVVCDSPAAPVSGDPVRCGFMTGVALTDEGETMSGLAATETVVDFGPAAWSLSVKGVDGSGNSAVALWDTIFYVDADTPKLSKKSSGYFFGFALGTVLAGATTTITVLHVPSPGSGTLGAGTVGAANLANSAVETAKIAAAAVTKVKLAGGFSKLTLAAGTAAATNVNIAGIVVGDELVSVLSFTTAAAIASVADRTSEYVVGAGVLTKAAGTDETNNQLVVIWNDLT
jgi:hypothetical protein